MFTTLLFVLVCAVAGTQGEHACICLHGAAVTNIYASPDASATVLGNLFNYDCIPLYSESSSALSGWQIVASEHQVGYVKDAPTVQKTMCPGDVPDIHKISTTFSQPTSSTTAAAPASFNTITTVTTNATTRTMPKPATTVTTPMPATTATKPKATITSSVTITYTLTTTATTPKPTTTTTTTTLKPTTTTTTPKPTTTTTPKPTTTTTPKPTTTTTPKPTTTTTPKPTTTTTPKPTTTTTTTTPKPTTPTTHKQTTTAATPKPTTRTPKPTTTTPKPTTTTPKPIATTKSPKHTTTTTPKPTTTTTTPKPITTTTMTTRKPCTTQSITQCQAAVLGRNQDHLSYIYTHCSYCYEFRNKLADWEHAKLDCQKHGGFLLSIQNEDEQNFVLTMLRRLEVPLPIWLGLHDQVHEEHWQWVSGLPLNYENWMSGSHNDKYHDFEDCALYVPARQGEWDDVHCIGLLFDRQASHPWICQYLSTTFPRPTSSTTAVAPASFHTSTTTNATTRTMPKPTTIVTTAMPTTTATTPKPTSTSSVIITQQLTTNTTSHKLTTTTTIPKSTTSTTTQSITQCPAAVLGRNQDHLSYINTHCSYCYEFRNKLTDWEHAMLDCQKHGGFLLSIQNEDEQNFVLTMLRPLDMLEPIWLGLHDQVHEEQWQWVSGLPLKYENWMAGSHHYKYHDFEDCALYVPARHGEWDDVHCKGVLFSRPATHPWICQYHVV